MFIPGFPLDSYFDLSFSYGSSKCNWTFIRVIKASKAIGYCSSLSIVESSRACSLGSVFKLCSNFSTLLVVKDFILS